MRGAMELLVRGEDPDSEEGQLLVKVEAQANAVRAGNHLRARA